LAGTQWKHINQLKEGFTPPKLSNDHFITPLTQKRALELATSALHFSSKIGAFLSLDQNGAVLQEKLQKWYRAVGYKYAQLDKNAKPWVDRIDEEEIFEEDT
jgi:hypothetical protein